MNKRMKILIGYDGVNPIARAIRDLKSAGLPKKAEVVVLTVVSGSLPPFSATKKGSLAPADKLKLAGVQRAKKHLVSAQRSAVRAAAKIRNAFPGWIVSGESCWGAPAPELIKKAEKWAADLVVVGSHDQPMLVKFFFGSAAQEVLHSSPCPVRVIRDRKRKAGAAVKIVIGVDGSRDCERAVAAVAGRAWPKGSSVRLVTAVDNPLVTAGFVAGWSVQRWIDEGDRRENEWIQRMSAHFGSELRSSGLSVSVAVCIGDPKHLLAGEGARWGADCIFVGARGLNKVERFFMLGSVSSSVAARARCSVEVIRRKRARK